MFCVVLMICWRMYCVEVVILVLVDVCVWCVVCVVVLDLGGDVVDVF